MLFRSIVLYDYTETRHDSGEPQCTHGIGTLMKIKSNYFGYDHCSFVNFICETRKFSIYTESRGERKEIAFKSEFTSEQYEGAVVLDSLIIPTIDTLITPSIDASRISAFDTILVPSMKIYHNVLYKDNLWFAPEVGIIKFVSPVTKSSFYLHRIHERFR